MPTPKKPLSTKEFIRPSRHADRLEAGKGINPTDYPPPSYFVAQHKKLWKEQLALFAPTLRPVDMLTFRMYIDAQIEYDELTEQLYKTKQEAKTLSDPENAAQVLEAVAMGQKAADSAFVKLMKLQDKMCANPYNRGRVPEQTPKEKSLEETLADFAR